ncbi:hypothetical protein ABL78_3428 [Leptomonas seymouri]|uniref:Uncharacterized protein n=1 Tax=Leptomonas seymouri TaxID=5684 RepID=A0A0N0P6C9_LEPSE|nr:hypothetical protein ABL78_3428 [Leptomonas seymouri]|eukprot:KPI87479.1 hypothetical protein ABL78_3428 [Leptomonas seymouri]
MTAAAQEMAELLREVQKLQKELQPVRSAVAALQKRESETPNPAAAGASLHKVAARLETVKHKYEPFLARLQELVSEEVPAFLQQTQLLAMSDESFEIMGASDAGHDAGGSPSPAAARTSNRSTGGDAKQSTQQAQEDAARLLHEVCPPSIPHLLEPENLRFTQQQLRLRAEVVEYLIATDRLDIADHVARSYGLPLQWFPRLVALHRERMYGGFPTTANATSTTATSSAHSPVGGFHTSAPTPTASPLVTPATRPRGVGGAGGVGMPPRSPIQLPPSAAPMRASSTSATPTDDARPPAGQFVSIASDTFTALPSPARPTQQRVGQSSPAPLSHPRGNGEVVEDSATTASTAALPGSSFSSPTTFMPDLVARVISAAMYLKDDYMDRMVLERTLEQSIGLVSSPPPPPPAPASDSASPTPLEQYKACVLSRIANIPRHHLHTQSGDPLFDSAMMNIIEDLLVYGLQRWAEDDTGLPEATTDILHGGETEEALAAETKKRKTELLQALTTDTFLTAEEMLLADKVWNEDILFLKRPTRFYCVETGLSSDEPAGTESNAPRALSTGEVVSQLVAEAQGLLCVTTGIFIT